MSEELEDLLLDQMVEVQGQHPNLELVRDPDARLWVRGAVSFSVEHESVTVNDIYALAFQIPDDYPASPPSVFEDEGRVPKEFGHFMDAGNFCLEAPVEVRRRFAQHRSLLRFIDDQVVPYLFACSYLRDFGVLPFADRRHGVPGLLDYYSEFFETSGIAAMRLLKCLADGSAPPLMKCPCKAGRNLDACHGPKLDELRPHLERRRFELELLQMIEFVRKVGVRLPERQVVPERVWRRRERRRRQKSRGGAS